MEQPQVSLEWEYFQKVNMQSFSSWHCLKNIDKDILPLTWAEEEFSEFFSLVLCLYVCVEKFIFSFIISILKPCTNSGVFRHVELGTESPLMAQITRACFSGGNWEPDKLLICSLGCHNYFLFFCYLEQFCYLKIGKSATRGSSSNLKIDI